MSGIDEARERLAKDPTRARPDDIRAVLAALDEAREVLAGADHTAAKYWRRMTEAERERDEAREARFQEREESNIAYQQRDELAAVIERAKAALQDRDGDPAGRIERILRAENSLSAVPADVLRERDAETRTRFADELTRMGVHTFSIHDIRKHARETKEQSDDHR